MTISKILLFLKNISFLVSRVRGNDKLFIYMYSSNNDLSAIKANIFRIIQQLEINFSKSIKRNKIDSKALYALPKLVDSFIKVTQVENEILTKTASKQENFKQDDLILIDEYGEFVRKQKMAPRAGLEPATKRLTAACSTTELPGNMAS